MIGMGSCLNHLADIVGDNDTTVTPQPFNGNPHRQRIVDPCPAMAGSPLCLTIFCNARVPGAGL